MLGHALRNAVLATVLVSAGIAFAADKTHDAHAPKAASPALDRFKALAGEWVAAEDGEMFKKGDRGDRVAIGGQAVNGSAGRATGLTRRGPRASGASRRSA